MSSLSVWFALSCVPALASAQSAPPAPPISWSVQSLKSAVLGTERKYFVSLPQGYEQGNSRFPVLVVLDANDQPQFVAAIANLQFLASRNEAPALIVVGIPNGPDRTHDMTVATKASDELKMFPTAGGADAFARFISDEVLPAVRASYRTLPSTFLAGHSFGGLFALHIAASDGDTYKGLIAMSPSLQWSNTEYVTFFSDMLRKRKQPLRLFVSSGGLEPPIDVNAQHFIARMDSTPHPGLSLRYRRYPDDTHGLTPMPSLVDGVRFMFEPISLRAAQTKAMSLPKTTDTEMALRLIADTEREYAEGARGLGLPEKVPEDVLNQWGYGALQAFDDKRVSVAIFRRNVELYPGSANVYDSLGDALLARGDTVGARAQFTRAVELAKQTGHPVLAESTRKLQALSPKP